MERKKSSGPNSYPVQSSVLEPPANGVAGLENELPQPIHLPKNIRAVQDADNYQVRGRTIVVCLDGTGDKFDSDNSNIVHLVSCLKKDDKSQTTYYQSGIGTYSANGLSSGFQAAMDMAVGSGLGLHVRDAYHFLMHTYKEGDKICIFGFSRGAYTARCLAGMVHKVGLLPPRNVAQIPFAYEFYKDDTPEGWKASNDFKQTFCIEANIYFLGAFDSVASVGFIPRQLPLSSTPTSKSHYFRHAMALDEHRAKFEICRYQSKDRKALQQTAPGTTVPTTTFVAQAEQTNGTSHTHKHVNGSDAERSPSPNNKQGKKDKGKKGKKKMTNGHNLEDDDIDLSRYDIETGHVEPFDTNVLEVWFLGCRADVGGGAVKNEERHKLSQIPLRWMIRQCFECDTGIIFKTKKLAEIGLDIHTLWPTYRNLGIPKLGPSPSIIERYEQGLPPLQRRSTMLTPVNSSDKKTGAYQLKISDPSNDEQAHAWLPEQVEDYFDAMSICNDQLSQARIWWILEIWPVSCKKQKPDSDEWTSSLGLNLGKYRPVEDIEPNLHWTVRHRMHNMGYKMKARFGRNATWQIVD